MIEKGEKKEVLSVFIPTTPAPFTGFVIIFPAEDVVFLDIPVEQALKFVVSGGIAAAEGLLLPKAK
jgi:uncharacterized membrane protein